MKFSVGDKVRRIEYPDADFIPVGLVGTIVEVDPYDAELAYRVDWGDDFGDSWGHPEKALEKVYSTEPGEYNEI